MAIKLCAQLTGSIQAKDLHFSRHLTHTPFNFLPEQYNAGQSSIDTKKLSNSALIYY